MVQPATATRQGRRPGKRACRRRRPLAWLWHPAVTGLPSAQWDTRITTLTALHEADGTVYEGCGEPFTMNEVTGELSAACAGGVGACALDEVGVARATVPTVTTSARSSSMCLARVAVYVSARLRSSVGHGWGGESRCWVRGCPR